MGRNAARHDVCHSDIILAVVEHRGLAESVQSELRGIVRASARKGVLPSQAAYIDDAAAAGLFKPRKSFSCAIKGARQVDSNHPVPFFNAQLCRGPKDTDTGVIHQNVEPA